MIYAYPEQLAEAVIADWPIQASPAPSLDRLNIVLSTCFQASLLREEERLISFRMILGPLDAFPPDGGPPEGLQVLPFSSPREFTCGEIRRLSPAVEFHRAMIGATCTGDDLRIWGVIHTGPRWVRDIHGGRDVHLNLPPMLIVLVNAPGDLAVYCGVQIIATLSEGVVRRGNVDIFKSRWLPSQFADVREEVMQLHIAAREAALAEHPDRPWAMIDPDFMRMLAQHVLRRTVSVIRSQRHGGTMLFMPPEPENDGSLVVKYPFVRSPGRGRFRSVMVDIMNTLAEIHSGVADGLVGWRTYSQSSHRAIVDLDEAVFEVGHLFAGLSAVDGALVLTQRLEVHGFGAEISSQLPPVETVWRAMDLEGTRVAPDLADRFGTRHRSVFRLCQQHPAVIAIVISQDGQVRFVRHMKEHGVVYFDHRMLGA
ncbi:MAG: putative sensor domain DACNV-containing protein [Planctomycetaceae bacterium]